MTVRSLVILLFSYSQSFLKGETQIPSDEAFQVAVVNFSEIFLKSERVTGVVAGGGLSYNDCREIFKHQVEKVEVAAEVWRGIYTI